MSMSKLLKQYFAEIGQRGGSVKSERKTYACRENGKKGGRPRQLESLEQGNKDRKKTSSFKGNKTKNESSIKGKKILE